MTASGASLPTLADGVPHEFPVRVVQWQRASGRSGLPWQATRDPYRVWLSEIMLQQTQVTTVLAYYGRFLERFPDVRALAAAAQDEVLGLWSGLGYYSRARNLHRCAQEVVASHGGAFPREAATLRTLPGIGRSTAAAIAAFCFSERVAILDGNVKRVLARVRGFAGDLAVAREERALWDLAQGLVPADPADMPAYTQGLMDLGATVCTARAPRCAACPAQALCVAYGQNEPTRYPVRTRKLKRSAQSLWLLQARRADGAVWLEKRPQQGVWAGLYCLPAFDSHAALAASVPARSVLQEGTPFVHVLTHKDLHLHPVVTSLDAGSPAGAGGWFGAGQWPALGLPAPVRKLLEG
ncbi:MAG: A/G-specific adenine glycosylase [Pseudomonadota bacterium]